MFTSKTENGNVATSNSSQYDADFAARRMDVLGCRYCTDCTDCAYCMYCRDCANCTGCTGCTSCISCKNCSYCNGCAHCEYCSNCRDCEGCRGCNDCANWSGNTVRDLLYINAVPWNISVSATHMQIGCINETHQWWQTSPDEDVAAKGRIEVADVVEYRLKYGALIASALEVQS